MDRYSNENKGAERHEQRPRRYVKVNRNSSSQNNSYSRGREERRGTDREYGNDNRYQNRNNSYQRDSQSQGGYEDRRNSNRNYSSQQTDRKKTLYKKDYSSSQSDERRSYRKDYSNNQSEERRVYRRDDNRYSSQRPTYNRRNNTSDEESQIREELRKKHYSKKKQLAHQLKNEDETKEIRLNRYISMSGVCSRRDADILIQEGRVKVNGVVVQTLGAKVLRKDEVTVDDKVIVPERKVYIVLNKPKDYVTTVDDPLERKTVMSLIEGACKERIYPVGRLDRLTTGILLFTNDGDLSKKLTHPKYEHKKIYHVFLDHPLAEEDMQKIRTGLELEDGFIKADEISYVYDDPMQVGIEIHSGRNRIVRRIFEYLGYHIIKLDRVYFAGITKKNLPRGKWRFLTSQEVRFLKVY